MPVNLIILTLFFLMMAAIALLYREATLDKLKFLEDETLLFEEYGTRVEQSGGSHSVVFINCIVRVTDRRIIIAQKMLFRTKYALRHVIFYSEGDDETGLKHTLLKGYILMRIDNTALQLEQQTGNSATVRIKIPETPLTRNQYILYDTNRAGDYRNLLVQGI
ncbi:MAG TPA: hypothetical protein PK514_09005 [Spirochaetota bacterium]|nr:hypothetical protein [Spirochaetota bacterium]